MSGLLSGSGSNKYPKIKRREISFSVPTISQKYRSLTSFSNMFDQNVQTWKKIGEQR